VQFEYPDDLDPHWNEARPEWSHVANAGSLLMPYLEPYLIDSIRESMRHIDDPGLREEAKAYMGQEAHHWKQHRKFNELLLARGYERLRDCERVLEEDYARIVRTRSLKFHLAYAAGFETMALAIGHMLVDDREYFFAGADPAVSSLVLWHFVEEIEHKHAAFGVYQHVFGGYLYRVYGLLYAMYHTLRRTRQAYVALLEVDGVWGTWRTRWAMKTLLFRIFRYLTPRLLESMLPTHDPRKIADPTWTREWVALYDRGEARLIRLDTARMHLSPAAMLG
jgi:predicted metal-dependent hydrolase